MPCVIQYHGQLRDGLESCLPGQGKTSVLENELVRAQREAPGFRGTECRLHHRRSFNLQPQGTFAGKDCIASFDQQQSISCLKIPAASLRAYCSAVRRSGADFNSCAE